MARPTANTGSSRRRTTTTIGAIRSTLAPVTQAAQFLTREFADAHYMDLTDPQTVAGVKTFGDSPAVPAPVNPVGRSQQGLRGRECRRQRQPGFAAADRQRDAEHGERHSGHGAGHALRQLPGDGLAQLRTGGRRHAAEQLQRYVGPRERHLRRGGIHFRRRRQRRVLHRRRSVGRVSQQHHRQCAVGNQHHLEKCRFHDGLEWNLLLRNR